MGDQVAIPVLVAHGACACIRDFETCSINSLVWHRCRLNVVETNTKKPEVTRNVLRYSPQGPRDRVERVQDLTTRR